MWPVCYTTKRTTNLKKKTTELLYIQKKYHMYNQLSIKKNIYIYYTQFIQRGLLKFFFHIIGRPCRPIIRQWGGVGLQEMVQTPWRTVINNLLMLSATFTKTLRRSIMNVLGLMTLIIRSPDESNTMLKNWQFERQLDSLELEAFPRKITYATGIKQVSDLYNYLCTEKTSNIHKVGMFHSETRDEKKSDII